MGFTDISINQGVGCEYIKPIRLISKIGIATVAVLAISFVLGGGQVDAYSKLTQYNINTHLDWEANNGSGRTTIAWDNSELIKQPNAGYRVWVQTSNQEYSLNDPQSWNSIQSVSSQEHTEPIYIVNLYNDIGRWIVEEDPVKNGGVRMEVCTPGDRYANIPYGTFEFNEYSQDGSSTNRTYQKVLPLSAQLKLWMEGGTVKYDTTYTPSDLITIYKIHSNESGTNTAYETIFGQYRFTGSQTYGNYGKSPYDDTQLIRVIPISFQEFYNSLVSGNSSIIKYNQENQTYSINIDSNAFYDANGKEVTVDEVYMGTWDGTTDMYQLAVGQEKYQSGQKFIQTLIENGVPVIFGHDTNMMSNDDNIKYFGIDQNLNQSNQFYTAQQNIVIQQTDSPILSVPYKFTAGQVIKVPYSHQTSQVYLGETLAEFQRTPATQVTDGNLQFWAGVGNKQTADAQEQAAKQKYNNPNANAYTFAGVYKNTALIQVGHTTGQSSDDMNKLITNILFYLKQNSKKSVFIDDNQDDKDAPAKVTYTSTKTNSQNNTVTVNFNAASDIGTDYYYVQQYFKPGRGQTVDFINNNSDALAQSNVAKQNVRSGVKWYYYIVDSNQGTEISADMLKNAETTAVDIQSEHGDVSSQIYGQIYKFQVQIPYQCEQFYYNNGTEIEQIQQKVVVDEQELVQRNYSIQFRYNMNHSKTYIHVAAVDASGNLGDTQTISVDRPIEVIYDKNQSQVKVTVNGSVPKTAYISVGDTLTVDGKGSLDTEGYRFLGWSMDKQKLILPGTVLKFDSLLVDSSGKCVLYAMWSKLNTLTINPNGGIWKDTYGVELQPDVLYPESDYADTEAQNKEYKYPIRFNLGPGDSKKIIDSYRIGYNFYGWQINGLG